MEYRSNGILVKDAPSSLSAALTRPRARMSSPLLYEINTRCWLRRLSDRQGGRVTLATVPDSELARWRDLGFTHIWLMGVWATGPRTRAVALASEDFAREFKEKFPDARELAMDASPYAIAEYRVASALGGEAGLQAFRRRLHECGLKLVLDFVPNHVGLDHSWLRERPDLFVQSAEEAPGTFAQETRSGLRFVAHGRDPHFPPWTDTAQLDYRRPATRKAMVETLLSVAGKCDGVRCDMAMLVLNDVFAKTWEALPPLETGKTSARGVEALSSDPPGDEAGDGLEFWREAIQLARRKYPDFLFLAEVYWGLEGRLEALGFDYTYDKELYDALVHRDPEWAQGHLLAVTPHFIETSAHFLENHDEARIASRLTLPEHRAAALLILGLPGMRFLYDGQLEGAQVKVPVQFLRQPEEPSQPEIEQLYGRLLRALPQSAVGRGKGTVLKPREAWPGNVTARNLILVQWQAAGPDFELVVVNLAAHRSQCYAPLSVPDLGDYDWRMQDRLGPERYRRPGKELQSQGLYLDIPENGAQWFHFQPERR